MFEKTQTGTGRDVWIVYERWSKIVLPGGQDIKDPSQFYAAYAFSEEDAKSYDISSGRIELVKGDDGKPRDAYTLEGAKRVAEEAVKAL